MSRRHRKVDNNVCVCDHCGHGYREDESSQSEEESEEEECRQTKEQQQKAVIEQLPNQLKALLSTNEGIVFQKAMSNVPDYDIQLLLKSYSRKMSCLVKDFDVRNFIALCYWNKARCNNKTCKTPNGINQLMKCGKCKQKFCGDICMARYHKSNRCVYDDFNSNFNCCAAENCNITENVLSMCPRCCLVFWCSADCSVKDFEEHSKRCCKRDAKEDHGPMAKILLENFSIYKDLIIPEKIEIVSTLKGDHPKFKRSDKVKHY